jgi:diguanylate cyclase (GGDEF)-like protein/PAS domain S-box-containing protein
MIKPTARSLLIGAVLAALIAAYVAIPRIADAGTPVLNAYNLYAVASAAVLIAAVAVQQPRPMWPWLLFAGAILSWVLGDAVYIWIGGAPVVSFADAFYIPAYIALIVACLGLLRLRTDQRDTDSLLDAAMVTVAAALTLWELVVHQALQVSGVAVVDQVMASLYPLLDVILLCMLIRLLLAPGRRVVSLALLAAGMGAVLLADTTYALLLQTDLYAGIAGRSLDATWLLGYALFPVAALHPSMVHLTERAPSSHHGHGRGRLVIAGMALVTVPLVNLAGLALGRSPDIAMSSLATLTIVPLVLWRILRLNRSTNRAREVVALQESYYRAVAMHSSDAFVVVDRHANVRDASPALETLIGLSPDLVIGADSMSIILDEDRDLATALLTDSLGKPGLTVTAEVRIRAAGDRPVWIELRCTNLLDDAAIGGIVVNTHDITGRKQIEGELEHQAFHDSLTALANRALLKNRIDRALAQRSRGNEVAVVFCDLDGLKYVNDTLGHDAGDEMLKIAGQRLSSVVRTSDTVARLGGDEFAVLLEGARGAAEEFGIIADRMRDTLAGPAEIGGIPLVVTGSFGIAVAGEGGQTTSDELLRDADTAMYRAKAAGRNQVARYKPSMRAADLSRAQLTSDLSLAVERDELVLQYQPVVALDSQTVVGFEALVRWDHPARGRLQPNDFIELAEETGAIVDIGHWVLLTACTTAESWRKNMPEGAPFTLAVNLSARQLAHPRLVRDISDALATSGLPPSALVLELTESVIVERPDEVAARFRQLKALGVHLAIDDFGVGYSSLSYLRQFPVDILKIDRSFIDAIHEDGTFPAIVRGLLDLARTLGLETVAEGVETETQRRALVREGCKLGQGYLFAKPLDESAATDLLSRKASLDVTSRQ